MIYTTNILLKIVSIKFYLSQATHFFGFQTTTLKVIPNEMVGNNS